MATHSSVLAWKIPWMEEPGRLQSMGSQRVRNNWVINTFFLSWSIFNKIAKQTVCLLASPIMFQFFSCHQLILRCAHSVTHSCSHTAIRSSLLWGRVAIRCPSSEFLQKVCVCVCVCVCRHSSYNCNYSFLKCIVPACKVLKGEGCVAFLFISPDLSIGFGT